MNTKADEIWRNHKETKFVRTFCKSKLKLFSFQISFLNFPIRIYNNVRGVVHPVGGCSEFFFETVRNFVPVYMEPHAAIHFWKKKKPKSGTFNIFYVGSEKAGTFFDNIDKIMTDT